MMRLQNVSPAIPFADSNHVPEFDQEPKNKYPGGVPDHDSVYATDWVAAHAATFHNRRQKRTGWE